MHERPVHLQQAAVRKDSLVVHIEEHNLQLEFYGHVAANGDCFYDSLMNLILHQNLDIDVTDAIDLRQKIVNSIKQHPNFKLWKECVFRNNGRLVQSFIARHSKTGCFTDMEGIVVLSLSEKGFLLGCPQHPLRT